MNKQGLVLAVSAFSLLSAANADQVILDDLIVDGSNCVGQDCVNGESFGFDTVRLKENNLRIRAVDTSTSASFPTNDWQITFNDSANGGQNKFAIEDIDGGKVPFTIEASAPSHSLYVDDGGRVGLGTNAPVVEAHIKDGDTPTIRLEQDGSSGFTPQTWDVAGNETNFFVRDVTNGSKLSFRIKPSAPENSLFINTDGNIGLGTASPSEALHVKSGDVLVESGAITAKQSGGSFQEMFVIENDSGLALKMDNTSADAVYVSINNPGTLYTINFDDGDGAEFQLAPSGNLTLAGQIITAVGNSCAAGCDAVFSPEHEVPSIEEHAEFMWTNSHLEAVGPTQPHSNINLTAKTAGILHELEVAHIYIEDLHKRLAALEVLVGTN